MKAYIYNEDTKIIIAEIKGDSEQSIEAKYCECFDTEENGLTYSPAFGFNDGLINDGDFEVIDVRG
jgi:hypothetical protein